jgi:hypothetical protein
MHKEHPPIKKDVQRYNFQRLVTHCLKNGLITYLEFYISNWITQLIQTKDWKNKITKNLNIVKEKNTNIIINY